jgi:hypothetical protein
VFAHVAQLTNGRFGFHTVRSFGNATGGRQVGTDGLATAQNYDPVTRPRRQSVDVCSELCVCGTIARLSQPWFPLVRC